MTKLEKTCKRHKWQSSGDYCDNCGYYNEYCERDGCYATRLLKPNGKEVCRYD